MTDRKIPQSKPFSLRLGPVLTRLVRKIAASEGHRNTSLVIRRTLRNSLGEDLYGNVFAASEPLRLLALNTSEHPDIERRVHHIVGVLKLTPVGESPELVKALARELQSIRAAQDAPGGLHKNLPIAFDGLLDEGDDS